MFRKIGLRTIKTAISIGLGMLFYIILRIIDDRTGLYNQPTGFRFSDFFSPFFAGIAAAYSLYPSKKQSFDQAKNRVIASLLGGVVGIALTIGYGLIGKLSGNTFFTWPNLGEGFSPWQYIVPYSLVTIGVLVVVMFGNAVHKKSAIFVGILTFISVTINPMGMIVNRYNDVANFLGEAVFGFNRILSTVVGVGLSLLVNLFKLPRRHKNTDLVFYVGIGGLLKEDSDTLNGFFKYKLIEAYERGIPTSIFTTRAPMTFMHLLNDIHVTAPICCMSGAALYDSNAKKFVYLEYMDKNTEKEVDSFLNEFNIHPFKNYVFDDSVVIINDDYDDEYNKIYFASKKDSAYCNITKTSNYEGDLIYYLYLNTEDVINDIAMKLKTSKFSDKIHIVINNCYEPFGRGKNLKYLKIYDRKVKDLLSIKKYLSDNNMRLASLTAEPVSNYLLDISDYRVTFKSNTEALNVDHYLDKNSYEQLFRQIKKMYYSKEYMREEVKDYE